jgi:hypothetical protein
MLREMRGEVKDEKLNGWVTIGGIEQGQDFSVAGLLRNDRRGVGRASEWFHGGAPFGRRPAAHFEQDSLMGVSAFAALSFRAQREILVQGKISQSQSSFEMTGGARCPCPSPKKPHKILSRAL